MTIETFGANWVIIGLMLTAAFAMGMTLLILNWIVAPRNRGGIRGAPYGGGRPKGGPGRGRATRGSYLVGRCSSWSSTSRRSSSSRGRCSSTQLGLYGFVEMVVFIALLFVGYVYAWKKGALEWV